MTISEFAPVALFVFARPEHTKATLKALSVNQYADKTDVIVFSDGPRNESDKDLVLQTRKIVRLVRGFKSLRLIEFSENRGLAKNIIQGVTDVSQEYGRVIVLEDDIVTSVSFLKFMNEALRRYEFNHEVWHINGWNYPLVNNELPSTYFWRLMHCWGWATWNDRWCKYNKDPRRLIETWTSKEINTFNLDGSYDFWSQIVDNDNGKLNTWAAFWYSTIFENKGFCLSPSSSLTQNIGLDGSGANCSYSNAYQSKCGSENTWIWPIVINENKVAIEHAKKYNKKINGGIVRKLLHDLYKTIIC